MRAPDPRRDERGATAVVVAILLTALAAFLMLVLNTGHVMATRNQLQNATDSAALAGAQELNGTVAGLDAARAVAADFSARHDTDRGMSITIDPLEDVVFGSWDPAVPRDAAFTEITSRTPQALRAINAVLVRAGRESARGNAVDVVAGGPEGLLDKETTDVRAASVAVRGGLGGTCPLIPLVIDECAVVTGDDGSLNCGETMVFNSDVTDNIGFTNLTTDPSVSTALLRDIIENGGPCVQVGERITVSNGANLSPLVPSFESRFPTLPTTVVAPVVKLDGGCPGKFNEHGGGAEIKGFVAITLTQILGAPEKSITFDVTCDWTEPPGPVGGEYYGAAPLRPRLMR